MLRCGQHVLVPAGAAAEGRLQRTRSQPFLLFSAMIRPLSSSDHLRRRPRPVRTLIRRCPTPFASSLTLSITSARSLAPQTDPAHSAPAPEERPRRRAYVPPCRRRAEPPQAREAGPTAHAGTRQLTQQGQDSLASDHPPRTGANPQDRSAELIFNRSGPRQTTAAQCYWPRHGHVTGCGWWRRSAPTTPPAMSGPTPPTGISASGRCGRGVPLTLTLSRGAPAKVDATRIAWIWPLLGNVGTAPSRHC